MSMTAPFIAELSEAQRDYITARDAAKERLQPTLRKQQEAQRLSGVYGGGTPALCREQLLGEIADEGERLRPFRERRNAAICACVTMGLSPREVAHVMCRHGERMAETKIKHIVTGGVPQAPLPHPGRVAH